MSGEVAAWAIGILALTVGILLRLVLGLERRVARLEGRSSSECDHRA